jgi:hypothetical protein
MMKENGDMSRQKETLGNNPLFIPQKQYDQSTIT